MENPKSSHKLALLGHGDLTDPIFKVLEKRFNIVSVEDAECLVIANYGKILSKDEINRPIFGAVNIHPSLLPKYRGPTPVQSAIKNGDLTSGYTIFKLDEQIDHGGIICQEKMTVGANVTTNDFITAVASRCSKILPNVLVKYFEGRIVPIPQDDSKATTTKKIDGRIILDGTLRGRDMYNLIKAYGSEPGVFVTLDNNEKLKIIEAKLVNGKIVPILVQRDGKQKMPYQDFAKGYRGNLDLFD